MDLLPNGQKRKRRDGDTEVTDCQAALRKKLLIVSLKLGWGRQPWSHKWTVLTLRNDW